MKPYTKSNKYKTIEKKNNEQILLRLNLIKTDMNKCLSN